MWRIWEFPVLPFLSFDAVGLIFLKVVCTNEGWSSWSAFAAGAVCSRLNLVCADCSDEQFPALPLLTAWVHVQPPCSKALGRSLRCSTHWKAGKSPCFVWVLCWGALWKRWWLIDTDGRQSERGEEITVRHFFRFSYEWGFLSWRWIVNNSFLLPKSSIEQLICVTLKTEELLWCALPGAE